MHVRDLNFVLRSEIFVHKDRQLRASHLILGADLVYSTWQSFSQALLVDNPLLSYIDIRHANFLPPSLTASEARDLGPRYTTAKDLAPVWDKSTEHVSQSRKVHVPVEELDTLAHIAEPEVAEANQDVAMVTKRKMTINRFLRDTHPMAQPQSGDRTPPPPSTSWPKKKKSSALATNPSKSLVMLLQRLLSRTG